MALNLDVSELTQSAAMKPTAHDNCIVLDLGTGDFPRDIEVRLPDDDGARQNALWDGSLNLDVNDEVLCFEYSGISAWRVMAMGGNDGGAGKVRVSEVWESDFGDVALQSDADGKIGIGIAPSAALEVFSTTITQLRLAFGATKYAEFSFDTSHLLTIDTTSVGHILLNATVRIVDEILHEGDFDTKIGLDDDKIALTAGGLLMFEAIEIAGQDTLDLGDVDGGGDVDIDFNDGQMSLQGSNGNVGIGVSPAITKLEVVETISGSGIVTLSNTSTGGTKVSLLFRSDNTTSVDSRTWALTTNFTAYGDFQLLQSNAKAGDPLVAGTDALVFAAATRYAGFGTPSPLAPLHVFRDVAGLCRFERHTTVDNFAAMQIRNTSTGGAHNTGFGSKAETVLADSYMFMSADDINSHLVIRRDGNIGFSVTAPQGIFHSYDTVSGFILWEYDGLDATIRTIIPNGAGDILYRLTAMYVLRDSAAAVASGTTDVSNGASVNLTVGGNTVRLRVNADGSCDIARTAGTGTIKVALVLRWL